MLSRSMLKFRRVKSTTDPDTSEKYHETPPISIVILLQQYAPFWAEGSIYTFNLYYDTAHVYRDAFGQGSLEHPQ